MKIAIIAKHQAIRKGLRYIIEETGCFKICCEDSSFTEAKINLIKLNPDIIIVDIDFSENISGIELIKIIYDEYHHVKIIALSIYNEGIFSDMILKEGADRYICKIDAADRIIPTINSIINAHL